MQMYPEISQYLASNFILEAFCGGKILSSNLIIPIKEALLHTCYKLFTIYFNLDTITEYTMGIS